MFQAFARRLTTHQIASRTTGSSSSCAAPQAHSAYPSDLEFAVTETLVTSDTESGVSRLRQLQDMGVQIAIHDFGTGYSALGQLHHGPVKRLKIDQVFIQGLEGNPHQTHIAVMIVGRGHATKRCVLARGRRNHRRARHPRRHELR